MSEVIDRYRDQLPMNEHMVTMDPPAHTRERALLMRLITSKRLKENEAFMSRLSDELLDEFVGDGQCEFIGAYSQPFAMLVVADLLGVPEADHQRFREGFGLSRATRGDRSAARATGGDSTHCRGSTSGSAQYIEDRRRKPRKDVLTDLALATYPDGSMPEVTCRGADRHLPVRRRTGDDGTLAGHASLKYLAEHPELQERAPGGQRADPRVHRGGTAHREPSQGRLPPGPANHDPRRCGRGRRHAGHAAQRRRQPRSPAVRMPGAVPPRSVQRPRPYRLRPRRPHLSGRTLARVEGRISLERILDRMRDIRLSEEHHGPAGAAPLPLRADLGAARPQSAAPRVHPGRGGPMSRVAVVTGGASGIGLGVGRQFVADGDRVALLDRNRGGAEAAAAELRAEGATALAVEVRRGRPRFG